jgi:hypothetical protein
VIVGEDFADGQLVGIRHFTIREHPVVPLVLRVAGEGFLRPLVLVGGVVEDEVDDERDAVRTQFGGERGEVVHGPERGRHLPVAADGVAPVGVVLGREEQRHEMQVGEPELKEVRDARAHAAEIRRVAIDVADTA